MYLLYGIHATDNFSRYITFEVKVDSNIIS